MASTQMDLEGSMLSDRSGRERQDGLYHVESNERNKTKTGLRDGGQMGGGPGRGVVGQLCALGLSHWDSPWHLCECSLWPARVCGCPMRRLSP